jgi:L-seryl-tRNA(Ser) seleniumtransferase
VLERSGAALVEVGTTNRLYIEDFERALSPRTALLLRTHASNFRIEGFVHDVTATELVALGRRAGVPVVEDLGSGALADLAACGAPRERTAQEALADGIGLVAFSGDKLLGGPQAGIVAGRAPLIARMRGNPLLRALRVDKMTLAALAATLQLYRDGSWRERIPIYRMISATLEELRGRARAYAARLPAASVIESDAYAGGGALAQERIASIAVAVNAERPERLAARLRANTPPIVGRIEGEQLVLDLRTIAPDEDQTVISALERLI